MNNKAQIGIFDSGLGGLTVVDAVRRSLPNENIIYLGDTARVPYGDKSKETILRFGLENASFMAANKVKMIIVACNTVSSLAINEIRSKFANIPIIGVLEAGVQAVLQTNPTSVAIIGTRATIASKAYNCEISKCSPDMKIITIPCPLFAPIVEEGLADHEIGKKAIEFYLHELLHSKPETLLLGCTHYPLLKNSLKAYLPDSIKIIDSATAVAKFAKQHLEKYGLKNRETKPGVEKYYVTDSPEGFAKHAEQFLGKGKIVVRPYSKRVKNEK
jgi:glutamate racemase